MGLATLAIEQSGRAAKKRHAPDLPRRSTRLTNEVDRCAIGRKRGAEERHASLGWDNPHVARGRRLADPQAVVVAIALHVGDVSPVGRDRRPLRIAARRQLRDLEIGERRWLARRRLRVGPQQPRRDAAAAPRSSTTAATANAREWRLTSATTTCASDDGTGAADGSDEDAADAATVGRGRLSWRARPIRVMPSGPRDRSADPWRV